MRTVANPFSYKWINRGKGRIMANKRWTDQDVEDLRRRVEAGQGVRQIATELQRSQEATRARMQMLGLTKPRQFKAERAAPVEQPVLQGAEQ